MAEFNIQEFTNTNGDVIDTRELPAIGVDQNRGKFLAVGDDDSVEWKEVQAGIEYSAGDGIGIQSGIISVTGDYQDVSAMSAYYEKSAVDGLLADKVDKEPGKGLSTNDYTDEDKAKLEQHVSATDNPHQVTKEQVGLGNVGNFKAVSTEASQGLASTEKQNARGNIDAMENVVASGDSVFMNLDGVNLWVRASKGTYEVPMETVTIGGRAYPVVQIGNQIWMAENLDWKFPGMTFQPLQTPSNYTTSVGAYYEASGGIPYTDYGMLYNNFAVGDLDGLLPTGWHIPSTAEWNTLISYIGGAGESAKLKSTTGWDHTSMIDYNGTDDFGFNAKPAGQQAGNSSNVRWSGRGYSTYFWAKYNTYESTPCYRIVENGSVTSQNEKYMILASVRLVKNLE